jgi:hypothetical protein
MTLPVTAALALLLASLAALCGWLGARPLDVHRGPRLMPYRVLMLTFAAGCFWMLIHLANLAGMTTGNMTTTGS